MAKINSRSINKKLNCGRKQIINFNNISPHLSNEQITMLTNYYKYYHKQEYLFRHTCNFYRSLNIGLNTAIGVLTSSSIVALVSPVNPLVALTGAGVLICTAVSEGLSVHQKFANTKMIFQSYQEVLNDLRSYMRGEQYDENDLIKRLHQLENLINCIGTTYLRRFDKIYDKKYIISDCSGDTLCTKI